MGQFTRRMIIALALALGFLGGLVPDGHAAAPGPLLRVVHASSDAPALDVYVDGQRVTTAPEFGAVTPYTTVPVGNSTVQVLAAGAGPGGVAFLSTQVDLREGGAYTIVAADRIGQMVSVALSDTLSAATDGKAHVRLVHVSPDAPRIADVAVVGGPVVARNLPFTGATGYLAVDPGTYAFEIRPAGTIQALATTPPITLVGDRSYSVFVMGQLGNNTFQAIISADNADTGGVGSLPTAGGGGMASSAPDRAPLALGLAGLVAAAAGLVVSRRARRAGITPTGAGR
jgi:hypothetical protein